MFYSNANSFIFFFLSHLSLGISIFVKAFLLRPCTKSNAPSYLMSICLVSYRIAEILSSFFLFFLLLFFFFCTFIYSLPITAHDDDDGVTHKGF